MLLSPSAPACDRLRLSMASRVGLGLAGVPADREGSPAAGFCVEDLQRSGSMSGSCAGCAACEALMEQTDAKVVLQGLLHMLRALHHCDAKALASLASQKLSSKFSKPVHAHKRSAGLHPAWLQGGTWHGV